MGKPNPEGRDKNGAIKPIDNVSATVTKACQRRSAAWQTETRRKLQGGQHVARLIKIADKLYDEYQVLTKGEIAALTASARVSGMILNKVLPDLKSEERKLTVEGGVNHIHSKNPELQQFSESELLAIIAEKGAKPKETIEDADFTEVPVDN